ncbi:ligand-gated channel protein [Serratia fonticola]|uniref:Ligand-gated channel protein n=1 Tax=Serratia fonticola TaxID=47917 RepID=A0AAW3WXU5_SERFO|nr:ligand-gated channel protein [Serratia fonticola]MBC3215839.1 ligand-gated channel protein [Serratia fonticola]NYA16374.1 ligand-gated channel protein [Serratia fonticola]NYA36482.1 ligand-gated channel protein [Serratia fonticola]
MEKSNYPALSAFILASFSYHAALAASQDTMVVTASGFQQRIEDSAASISVIPRQQIEDKAYRDVTDALKDVPGVVVTGGASSSDISIRGMSSKYTLILVDGKRINTRGTRPNKDNAGIEQGWLPPLQAIERIEVVRGPMSSLYGSDAMGGVINIITRKTSTTTWSGSLHSDATFQENSHSGDLFQSNAYASGPLVEGLLGLRLNGLLSRRAEDRLRYGYGEQRMRSGTAVFSLTPNDKHQFDLEMGRSLQDRNNTPGMSWPAESCRNGHCQPNTRSEERFQRTHFTLSHNGYGDFGNINSYLQREETHNPGRRIRLHNTEFNSQIQFDLASHLLSLGGQYRYEDLHDEGNLLQTADNPNQLTRWSWALFAEDEWALTNDFTLTAGIRMERDQNYGTHWTPRAYGVWHLTQQWTIKGGVSGGYRSPDLRQSSASWGQITGGFGRPSIIIGNPALKPEKSLSEEVAIIWDSLAGLNASITLFNTDFKDKITEVHICDSSGTEATCSIGNTPYFFISDRVNVDKATMRGAEVTLGWDISQRWHLTANYTYTESEQKSGPQQGNPLNQMPKHMFNTLLNWQATQDVSLWSRLNLRSKTSDYLSRTTMSKGTPSYAFVDTGFSYRANGNLTIGGGVYNILDKTVDYEHYNTTLDGRRYTVGMTYNF